MKNKIFHKLPKEALLLVELFLKANVKIYLVGGSVRDFYLNKIPNDFDFTTPALPEETCHILKNYKLFKIGAKYGTIGVNINGIYFEITTFRSESGYEDNRHPSNIIFKKDILEDLKRRDFSINAIAYDIFEDRLIDEFNCLSDLKNGVIRCIGNPKDRFSEDSLRILRAFSFVSKLDFNIHNKTFQAVVEKKDLLKNIKIERFRAEIIKILNGINPKAALKLIKNHNILDIKFIPKNLNKIPLNYRIYALFLIFDNLDFINKNLKNEIEIIRNIFNRFKYIRKIKDKRHFFAHLRVEFDIKYIFIALCIKIALNKKNIIFKKVFRAKTLNQKLSINGNDLLKAGFSRSKIRKVKNILSLHLYSKTLPNERRILLKYAKYKINGIVKSTI
ncbi:MAG: CCA tRNA nucleotidyltransferase [Helicobacteraceae bacterium]|nr:CCA tRNA nucleotidyltransferase [Helicobacteraceae bacterium]